MPKFTRQKSSEKNPEIFLFKELILQTLIRHYLSNVNNLSSFLENIGVDELRPDELEILGEKALPEGHIDLLIKESTPIGMTRKIIIEVKLGRANNNDFNQLEKYLSEFGKECLKGVLIAAFFNKKALKDYGHIAKIKY